MAFNFKRAADELAAFTEQENALKVNVKFLTEYMVFFDSKKAEGPYNDVYMYCFIKHGLITKDTKICEKGTTKIQRAGDCDDLQDFFNLVSSIRHNNTSQETRQDSPEEELHKAWDKKMSKDLIDKFIQNAELFDTDDSAIIDEEILDSIYAQTENFDKEKGEVHFQVADFDGYAKEDLTNEQNEALKELAREVLRFLFHKKWDGVLPEELIDLTVDVADLFDDPYYPKYIDEKIFRFTYMDHENSSPDEKDMFEIEDMLDNLNDLIVDGVTPTPKQEKILREIATIQYNYIYS